MDIEDAYVDYEEGNIDNEAQHVCSESDVNDLKARVNDRVTDIEKMKLMKSVLDSRNVNSTQVREMMSWLAFESSRLDFAKWAYSRAVDKQDYWKLEDAFTFSSSKDEFNEYIKAN